MDRKYWDKISENYNTEIFDVLNSDKNGIIKSYINELASRKKTIADFGCAVGKWLPLISPLFNEVFAIDFSKSLLKIAEKKHKNLKNIHYLNVDMTSDYISSHKFDVILCVNAILTDVPSKRETFFKNIAQNININGHLVLVVPSLESALYSKSTADKYKLEGGIFNKKINTKIGKSEYTKLLQGIVDIDKVSTKHHLKEELMRILNDLGFQILKIEKSEYTWDTELETIPKWLKAPYPWDWVVVAKKIK